MIAVRNSAFTEKRDLHVGGLGAAARTGLNTLADLRPEVSSGNARALFKRARTVAEDANQVLRENPWTALSVVAALGLTVGFLLSRRNW